jgi:hypothetical protein
MPADFLLAEPAVDDATAGHNAFASALLARFGSGSIQNISGREIVNVRPPPPARPSDRAPAPRAFPALTLALPRMPKMMPPPATAATTTAGAGTSSSSSSSSHSTITPHAMTPTNNEIVFEPTSAEGLQALLDDTAALVIDLRPHAQFASARLPHALSLPVPSTLLKRPAFPLSKLADMLPASTRARVAQWAYASRVLVYDADGAAPVPGTNAGGLLRKFAAAGCPPAKLTWLKGGFQNVWRHHRELVDADPPSDDDDDASGGESDEPAAGVLHARQLPLAAFTLSSTTVAKEASSTSGTRTTPTPAGADSRPSVSAPRAAPHVAFNPFFDAIRQNLELAQGITERIPLELPAEVRARADELPFRWLRELARTAGADEGAEALAMQFYRIELAEQRRLTGIMQHHSREDAAGPFPYAITAGVEKGAKNRYRNIWPFEHARVRLRTARAGDDDYINASYVQPLGTAKRYIATQGPLPATFADFWTCVL